jgi:hypothetical protein
MEPQNSVISGNTFERYLDLPAELRWSVMEQLENERDVWNLAWASPSDRIAAFRHTCSELTIDFYASSLWHQRGVSYPSGNQ